MSFTSALSGLMGAGVSAGTGNVIGGAITGLANLVGGLFGQSSSAASIAQTNAMNLQAVRETNQYNDQEAQKSRSFSEAMMNRAIDFNHEEAQEQMNFQNAAAQTQRDYETQMSNTAYQRSVADMKAAGLNPILGVASGGASTPTVSSPTGAAGSISTPSSAMATGATARFQPMHYGNVIGTAVSSALQGAKAIGDIEALKAQVQNTNADTLNKTALTPAIAQQEPESKARQANLDTQSDLNRDQLKTNAAARDKIASDILSNTAGQARDYSSATSAQAQSRLTDTSTTLLKRYGDANNISGILENLGRAAGAVLPFTPLKR